jgi:hypothetical protein
MPDRHLMILADVRLPVEDIDSGPWEPAQEAAVAVGRRLDSVPDNLSRKVFANRPGELRVYWICKANKNVDAIRNAVEVLGPATVGIGEVQSVAVQDAGDFDMNRGMNWDTPLDS